MKTRLGLEPPIDHKNKVLVRFLGPERAFAFAFGPAVVVHPTVDNLPVDALITRWDFPTREIVAIEKSCETFGRVSPRRTECHARYEAKQTKRQTKLPNTMHEKTPFERESDAVRREHPLASQ